MTIEYDIEASLCGGSPSLNIKTTYISRAHRINDVPNIGIGM